MQGSDSRRRGLAFAVVVAVLAIVGIYLTTMSPSEPEDAVAPERPTESAALPIPSQAVPSQVASTPANFDVYSYLPLSRAELGAAADLARRFTAAYGSFRYDEDPAGFANRIKAFTTTEFGEEVTRTVTSPALVDRNKADQVVSQGSATVASIRNMTGSSVVFVVRSVRSVSAKSGASTENEDFAVTVVKVSSDWRIYNLDLADSGQEGDSSP